MYSEKNKITENLSFFLNVKYIYNNIKLFSA